jgi:adenosylcobyric acid synthase
MGTYVHGLFDEPATRDALLVWAGLAAGEAPALAEVREAQLDRLADTIEREIDIDALFARTPNAQEQRA